MCKILKYIISNETFPILFNTQILHSDISVVVSSAGFVIVNYDKEKNKFFVKCYGESSTLNIGSKKNDNLLIENFLNKKL
jgi:hypothetical protein